MLSITELCKELRRNQTDAEKVLWQHFRSRRFFNYKFLRQHPIYVAGTFGKYLYYIPDFYCSKSKLVIEADGPIHLLKKDYDRNRDKVLSELGLTILRFENEQIMNDTQNVLREIEEKLKYRSQS